MLVFRCEALVFTAVELHKTIRDTTKVAETIRRFAVNMEIPAEEVGILKKFALWLIVTCRDGHCLYIFFLPVEKLGTRCRVTLRKREKYINVRHIASGF